jgi:hypothetical protein
MSLKKNILNDNIDILKRNLTLLFFFKVFYIKIDWDVISFFQIYHAMLIRLKAINFYDHKFNNQKRIDENKQMIYSVIYHFVIDTF